MCAIAVINNFKARRGFPGEKAEKSSRRHIITAVFRSTVERTTAQILSDDGEFGQFVIASEWDFSCLMGLVMSPQKYVKLKTRGEKKNAAHSELLRPC